ncbi:hypothetical protein V6N13_145485 [Hibiscus sabdariffa]|uniref:Clp R domain-containing protein n=1 Tax=Hibiscus sabdariffa TaxID=183260 RepID=A0ABR2TPR4_9ROSI
MAYACGLQTPALRIRSDPISLYNKALIFGQDFRSPITSSSRLGSVAIQVAKFEGFTVKAIEAIMLAHGESRRLGHNYIGTEHILLGLIGGGTGLVANIFKFWQVKLKDAPKQVGKISPRGSGCFSLGFPFSSLATSVLLCSFEEARIRGHNSIEQEHLLLGLLGEPVARRVLKGFFKGSHPDWSVIYNQVIYYIGKGEGSAGNTTMPALVPFGTNKHIEKDPSLTMPSFSVDETILILKRVQVHYEIHHKLRYSDEALIAAAELSYQYISDCRLPDKAIKLIHEAGTRVFARHAQFLEATREFRREFRQVIKSKNEARPIGKEYYELRHRAEELRFQIGIFHEASKAEKVVTEVDIQDIVCSWTGIPAKQVISRLVNVEETLHKQVIGQDEAVKAVNRACVGLRNPMVRSTAVA